MSGRASSTVRSACSLPWKSGMSTSTRHCGRRRVRLADRAREDRRPAVRQVVAVDRCHDDVAEIEGVNRLCDPDRLAGIDLAGPAVRHGAVRARARADVAKDHERRGTVIPALADVRTARVLADGMQVQLAHQVLEAQVVRRSRRAHLQPRGLRRALFARRERDDAGHVSDYSGRALSRVQILRRSPGCGDKLSEVRTRSFIHQTPGGSL